MYIRVFMKNVKTHQQANWKYIWLPGWKTSKTWKVR